MKKMAAFLLTAALVLGSSMSVMAADFTPVSYTHLRKTISNMLECKSRGAYLMGLTNYGNYEIEDR